MKVSICIPTYNRQKYLQLTLDKITKQGKFLNTNDIEIVISDNCSTDNTFDLVQNFIKKYPNKIKYYKNNKNIGFANIYRVMSYADGDFLKINSDTSIPLPNYLDILLHTISKNYNEKNLLFFTNNTVSNKEFEFIYPNLNSFVKNISYYSTWVSAFGLWKEDFNCIKKFFCSNNASEIPQTYVLFELLSKGKKIFIQNRKIYDVMRPNKKGGYNIAQVFGNNYLYLLNEYKNFIESSTFKAEKKKILKFINFYYFDLLGLFAFKKTGYLRYMYPYYKQNFYFWFKYILYKFLDLIVFFPRILKKTITNFFN